HRRLGVIGVGVAVAVVVASSVTIVRGVPRATAFGVPAVALSGAVVGDTEALISFASFVAAAVYLRRRVAAHRRLMFIASHSIIAAAVFRIRWFGDGATFAPVFMLACIVALGVHDVVTRKRIHPATLVGIAVFLVTWVVLRFVAFNSGLGAAFVEWLR